MNCDCCGKEDPRDLLTEDIEVDIRVKKQGAKEEPKNE